MKKQGNKMSQMEELVDLGLKFLVFEDDRGEAYGCMGDGSAMQVHPIMSRAYRRLLIARYRKRAKRMPMPAIVDTAISILEAEAFQSGVVRPLNNRFARDGESILLALADREGRCVKTDRNGWIIEPSPILFRPYTHQAALPEPDPCGDIWELFSFVNLPKSEDRLLLLGWMVAALVPDIPRPILCLYGPEGSAKTTLAKMLRAIIDPSKIDSVNLPRSPSEMAQVIDHHAVPLFDNITFIKPWQADFLCSAVSGGGFSKRRLYTDSEDVVMSFKRAAIVTGISVPTSAPDLLERCLLIGLKRVSDEIRVDEKELLKKFAPAQPRILGGLLNTLSMAMREYDRIKLPSLPRMADFARWGAAASAALGFEPEDFLTILRKKTDLQRSEVIASDSVAMAILSFMRGRRKYECTATELMKNLIQLTDEAKYTRNWPNSPNHLSRRLHALETTLEHVGIKISWRKPGSNRRLIVIRYRNLAKNSGKKSL